MAENKSSSAGGSVDNSSVLTPRGKFGPWSMASSIWIYAPLVILAALGWWWAARMSTTAVGGRAMMTMSGMSAADGAMSIGAFFFAWTSMMAAMMLPAMAPVAALYARAAAMGRVAPTPFFVAAYLVIWAAPGALAYFAWRALASPLALGEHWAAWLAGGALIGAAVWQLTPAKSTCLRLCRSPLTFFLRFGRKLEHPAGAFRVGLLHGAFCFGCCWALMVVLVVVGSMNLEWMIGLAVLIFAEKNLGHGEGLARFSAVALGALGIALALHPSMILTIT